MTLIIAVGCEDGIVLAADSAASDGDTGIRQPAVKLHRVGNHPILFGCSGDVGLIQSFEEVLKGFPERMPPNIHGVRKQLKRILMPEIADARQYHVPQPFKGYDNAPYATTMFCIVCNGGMHILEVAIDGRDTLYSTSDFGHFCAIGSGKVFAQAVFRPHLYQPRSLEEGQVLAYRVVDDAIDMAAEGLGPPIRMFVLSAKGEVTELSDAQVSGLRDTAELWRQRERESLANVLAPQIMENEIELSVPLPDSESN